MSIEFIRKLPTPQEIQEQYPLPQALQKIKEQRDQEIRDIFTGKSDKFLVVHVLLIMKSLFVIM